MTPFWVVILPEATRHLASGEVLLRGSYYATASPASSNSPKFNDVCGPNGIRTRVYSPPRASL